jgi:GNAT superfamily N-acetyltransferase
MGAPPPNPRPAAGARADGKLESIITHLEMMARPSRPFRSPPRDDLSLARAERPTVSFYRYLYNTVGDPWLWVDRRKLDDATLAAIVQDPAVEVYVVYVRGVPAGYVELDRRVPGDIELAYLGIIPDFIGQKLGPYLLDWAIDRAWSYGPRRFWVHTCTLDHPGALPMYERAGFRPFKQETELVDDPRLPSR